ncbi:MAG TPA: cardiolipin synthase [Micropruina sp.]|nr:cardiolipin synthase [Micropruina sp.]
MIHATPAILGLDLSTFAAVLFGIFVVIDLVLRVIALGVVPENRRPSSGMAWLILILFFPIPGFGLFLLLGGTSVGRLRRDRQSEALAHLRSRVESLDPTLFAAAPEDGPSYLPSAIALNRQLGALPAVATGSVDVFSDYDESLAAMARAIDEARERVHIEFYIMAWDETTAPVFDALVAARQRGVVVRLLFDHLGSRKMEGFEEFQKKLDAAGFEWRPMLPLHVLKGDVRRPDLRNHRKILVIDGVVAFTGSQNLVERSYHNEKHRKAGRKWVELTCRVTHGLAASLDAVFATDWYSETGELLDLSRAADGPATDEVAGLGQVVPSGPGVVAENNLRLFTLLLYGATKRISLTSPYFVPDESLLYAVTTAAERGVEVELFVGEEGDQFMVYHAQRSYYLALLKAGVRIWLYEAPLVLHSKHFSIDDDVVVIGSSNMDQRSFSLNYEVSLMLASRAAVDQMRLVEDAYRGRSRELTLAEWETRTRRQRYVDNVMRLTAALQ